MRNFKLDLCKGCVRLYSETLFIEGFQMPVISFELKAQKPTVRDTREMRLNIARQLRMLARKVEASVQ